MFRLNPITMVVVGLVLMISGVVLPLLMVVKVLESTFLLNGLAYFASLAGLVLAMLGLFSIVKIRRDR